MNKEKYFMYSINDFSFYTTNEEIIKKEKRFKKCDRAISVLAIMGSIMLLTFFLPYIILTSLSTPLVRDVVTAVWIAISAILLIIAVVIVARLDIIKLKVTKAYEATYEYHVQLKKFEKKEALREKKIKREYEQKRKEQLLELLDAFAVLFTDRLIAEDKIKMLINHQGEEKANETLDKILDTFGGIK